jgi:hypothetical protein
LRVLLLGQLLMAGSHVVRNNGAGAADPFVQGGIVVTRGSLSLVNGVRVSNNVGPGIRAGFNSGTFLSNVTIGNNSGDGVRDELQSVGDFAAPLSITGNGGASISCDGSSLIYGDLKGLSNIRCERISPAASSQ